jgi:heme o synthase
MPKLAVIEGDETTAKQIWIYSLLLIPATLLLVYPLNELGAVYAAIALSLGAWFLVKAWALLQSPSDQGLARSLFKYSILYMMLLSAGMAIDSLPITHQVVAALGNQVTTVLSHLPVNSPLS